MPENNKTTGKTEKPRRRARPKQLPDDAPEVASPCVSVCEMNDQTGYCSGCYRTLAEIATWSRMTNQQRWDIVLTLRERRSDAG